MSNSAGEREIIARLIFLAEELDPRRISEVLGADPTRSGLRGELRKHGQSRRKANHWSLHSPLSLGGGFREHWEYILGECGSRPERILLMSEAYKGMLVFTVKSRSNENIGIPCSVIRQLGECGLDLEMEWVSE